MTDTERKLELTRYLRQEQNLNRMKVKNREEILYGSGKGNETLYGYGGRVKMRQRSSADSWRCRCLKKLPKALQLWNFKVDKKVSERIKSAIEDNKVLIL